MVDENEEDIVPPTAARVARRAAAMSAVICRAFIDEFDEQEPAEALLSQTRTWLEKYALTSELEDWERELIDAPFKKLPRQKQVNATWMSEGLVILSWALNCYDKLPAHDEAVDPKEVTNSIGFLTDEIADILERPQLRGITELNACANQLLGLHWRLRDFGLQARKMDFKSFARDCWFGPMNIEGVALAEGDLSIKGTTIFKADKSDVGLCQGIAMERHQAINWLRGYGAVYSDVDTGT